MGNTPMHWMTSMGRAASQWLASVYCWRSGAIALSLSVTMGSVMITPMAAIAAQLTQWRFNQTARRLELTIPGGTVPQYFLLAQPPRIVVDLPNTKMGNIAETMTYSGVVRSIRVGQFQPELTRIVIELAPDAIFASGHLDIQAIGDRSPTDSDAAETWHIRPLLVNDDAEAGTAAGGSTSTPVASATNDDPMAQDVTPSEPVTPSESSASASDVSESSRIDSSTEDNAVAVSDSLTEDLPPLEPGALELPIDLVEPLPDSPSVPTTGAEEPSLATSNPIQAIETEEQPQDIALEPDGERIEIDLIEADPIEADPGEVDPIEADLIETEPVVNNEADPSEPQQVVNVEADPVEVEQADNLIEADLVGAEQSDPIEAESIEVEEIDPIEAEPIEVEQAINDVQTREPQINDVELDPLQVQNERDQQEVPVPTAIELDRRNAISSSENEAESRATLPEESLDAEVATIPSASTLDVSLPTPSEELEIPEPVTTRIASSPNSAVLDPPTSNTNDQSSSSAPSASVPIIEFGQQLRTAQALPGADAVVPASEASNETDSATLLAAGTVLTLRYPRDVPLSLQESKARQEVLVTVDAVRDRAGAILVPAGSMVIGQFERQARSIRFTAQAIAVGDRTLRMSQAMADLPDTTAIQPDQLIQLQVESAVSR